MKCPKCGYVSFEYLDQCKGCGKKLESFKSEHGLYGYPPKDMMLIKFLEDKAGAEEAEEGVSTMAGEEDEDLENIVSGLGGVAQGAESDEDSASEISLDLEEGDTGDDAEEIVAGLTESAPEKKESGEIELTLDDSEVDKFSVEEAEEISLDEVEVEEPKASAPATAEEDEISLEMGEPEETPAEESDEIELSLDEVEVEDTKVSTPAATVEDDEISLDLDELNAGLEIDDEATIDQPKKGKKYDDSEDELKLELE